MHVDNVTENANGDKNTKRPSAQLLSKLSGFILQNGILSTEIRKERQNAYASDSSKKEIKNRKTFDILVVDAEKLLEDLAGSSSAKWCRTNGVLIPYITNIPAQGTPNGIRVNCWAFDSAVGLASDGRLVSTGDVITLSTFKIPEQLKDAPSFCAVEFQDLFCSMKKKTDKKQQNTSVEASSPSDSNVKQENEANKLVIPQHMQKQIILYEKEKKAKALEHSGAPADARVLNLEDHDMYINATSGDKSDREVNTDLRLANARFILANGWCAFDDHIPLEKFKSGQNLCYIINGPVVFEKNVVLYNDKFRTRNSLPEEKLSDSRRGYGVIKSFEYYVKKDKTYVEEVTNKTTYPKLPITFYEFKHVFKRQRVVAGMLEVDVARVKNTVHFLIDGFLTYQFGFSTPKNTETILKYYPMYCVALLKPNAEETVKALASEKQRARNQQRLQLIDESDDDDEEDNKDIENDEANEQIQQNGEVMEIHEETDENNMPDESGEQMEQEPDNEGKTINAEQVSVHCVPKVPDRVNFTDATNTWQCYCEELLLDLRRMLKHALELPFDVARRFVYCMATKTTVANYTDDVNEGNCIALDSVDVIIPGAVGPNNRKISKGLTIYEDQIVNLMTADGSVLNDIFFGTKPKKSKNIEQDKQRYKNEVDNKREVWSFKVFFAEKDAKAEGSKFGTTPSERIYEQLREDPVSMASFLDAYIDYNNLPTVANSDDDIPLVKQRKELPAKHTFGNLLTKDVVIELFALKRKGKKRQLGE